MTKKPWEEFTDASVGAYNKWIRIYNQAHEDGNEELKKAADEHLLAMESL